MDFVASLTGKSPATTGFGSEGALTKGPFNAFVAGGGSNNALVSAIVTAMPGLRRRRDMWGRISGGSRCQSAGPGDLVPYAGHERDPEFLKAHGYLEQVSDFRLGGPNGAGQSAGLSDHPSFCRSLFGRIFETPDAVFPDRMLRPEKAGSGHNSRPVVEAIVETQTRVRCNILKTAAWTPRARR